MSNKTAYVWGPISNFSASLIASLLENNWRVHLASKSVLQISLSPLDLASSAQHSIAKAAGGAEKLKRYRDQLVFLDGDDPQRATAYDIALFMGLPSNYDEPRVSRAPWAGEQLSTISGKFKDVSIIVVSSLWGGIQSDGTVPEEIEFERRKPRTHFEGVCQQYEAKILKSIGKQDNKWHLVRLPLILGSSIDGRTVNFSGLYKLLQELTVAKIQLGDSSQKNIELTYNPDANMWMLPADMAAGLMVKLIEDSTRPTICNLLSTQSTLNQEWMQELARSLEIDAIQVSDKDNLILPNTLRAILNDNIHIKTRNLFEVMGKYQQAPMTLPSEYFSKVLSYAAENNWGQSRLATPEPPFSTDKAREYFEHFLPEHLDKRMLKTLATFDGGLAFQVAEQEDCKWLLLNQDGKASVSPFNPETHKPQVSFTVAAPSFSKLCSGKMMFEQALLTRVLQVNGGPIQSLKACDFLRRFLRRHHFSTAAENNGRILEGAASD